MKISDTPGEDGSLNSGNGVTDAVKVLVKMNRLVGIHVTPTVVVSFLFYGLFGGGSGVQMNGSSNGRKNISWYSCN